MIVSFSLPDHIGQQLRDELGDELELRAKEGFLIELYRLGELSLGQLAEILGIAIYEADGWLKQRQVGSNYRTADFVTDLEVLRRKLDG